MSRIKTLYTYLITNRRDHLDGWLEEYEEAIKDVAAVRAALVTGLAITAKETYANTSFKTDNDPWLSFARRHLYEKSNGVASRGRSTLSDTNFNQFIADSGFRGALAKLIQNPDKLNFSAFDEAWGAMCKKLNAGRNPLLVNRMLAACTHEVTSTVNGPDFMSVYNWLSDEAILPGPKPSADWYDKNTQVIAWLNQEFSEELLSGATSPALLSMLIWELSQNTKNPFSLKKQVIRYGAPGTGKTYTAKRDTARLFNAWQEKYRLEFLSPSLEECTEIVQFHPSFGYEDFMEGLRPVLLPDGQSQLRLQNGIFKEFCRKAGAWEIEVYSIPDVGRDLAKRWDVLTVGELKSYIGSHLRHRSWESIKIRPDNERIADIIPPYFFIIDEINRAELSRVLGELMFCLEYRGVGGAISTQYSSLNTKQSGVLQVDQTFKFFIPHNVYLVGTMNTIDRSVESFDLALRRRFRWEQVTPDITALRYYLRTEDKKSGLPSRNWAGLAEDLEKLNVGIRSEELLGADYEIGHAYLMNLRYAPTLTRSEVRENVWDDAIRPLLEEYLRGSERTETLIPKFAKAFGL